MGFQLPTSSTGESRISMDFLHQQYVVHELSNFLHIPRGHTSNHPCRQGKWCEVVWFHSVSTCFNRIDRKTLEKEQIGSWSMLELWNGKMVWMVSGIFLRKDVKGLFLVKSWWILGIPGIPIGSLRIWRSHSFGWISDPETSTTKVKV